MVRTTGTSGTATDRLNLSFRSEERLTIGHGTAIDGCLTERWLRQWLEDMSSDGEGTADREARDESDVTLLPVRLLSDCRLRPSCHWDSSLTVGHMAVRWMLAPGGTWMHGRLSDTEEEGGGEEAVPSF